MLPLGLEAILVRQVVQLIVDAIGSYPVDAALDGDGLLGGSRVFQRGRLFARDAIAGFETAGEGNQSLGLV